MYFEVGQARRKSKNEKKTTDKTLKYCGGSELDTKRLLIYE